jgi:hypothetical protein
MKFKNWLENNENELIIPAGSKLYHGSLEPFKPDQLTTGGYDDILWMAEKPYIAQTYIPSSGGTKHITPNGLVRPSNDPTIIKLQKKLGIFYDLNSVEWQLNGRPSSWSLPKKQDGSYWRDLDGEIIDQLLRKAGYVPKNDATGGYAHYEIKLNLDKILPPNTKQRGRLFIITVKEPLKIYDTNQEPDLTNIEYHNHKLFQWAKINGYDGVKISDFAQSDDYGNYGHQSIGVFKTSIPKLTWQTIQARHPDYEKIRNQNWETDEFLKFKSSQPQ